MVVMNKSNRDKTPPHTFSCFADIRHLVDVELKAVDKALLQALDNSVPLIPQMGHYLMASGGKRMRPLVMLLTAKMCGDLNPERIISLGAVIELIHGATLLHDDVVDNSNLRRGHKTANATWDNKASVLVGDFLFARAFQLMVSHGSLEILEVLSNASARIVEGEVQQLSLVGHMDMTADIYMDIIKAKTAPLFASAAMVGGMVNKQSYENIQALKDYGQALGILFQLQDDVLDYKATPHTWGKDKGDDFREGKVTLPVILAYEKADECQKDFWHRVFVDQHQEPHDLEIAISHMHTHGVFHTIDAIMHHYSHKAQNALKNYKGLYHQALLALSSYCLDRKF